jgi:hypothetical protein
MHFALCRQYCNHWLWGLVVVLAALVLLLPPQLLMMPLRQARARHCTNFVPFGCRRTMNL